MGRSQKEKRDGPFTDRDTISLPIRLIYNQHSSFVYLLSRKVTKYSLEFGRGKESVRKEKPVDAKIKNLD